MGIERFLTEAGFEHVRHADRLFLRLRDRVFAARTLAKQAVVTSNLVEWLVRDENRAIRDEIRKLRFSGLGDPGIAIRMTLLRQITPLQHEEGPRMELHIRMLEAGLALIDWRAVAKALEKHDEAAADRG